MNFAYDKIKFELEYILYTYTAMFNSKEYSSLAYAELQKINSTFPHIDDEEFWDKLNIVFIKNYNMNLQEVEKYLTQTPEDAETYKHIHIFGFIKQKN